MYSTPLPALSSFSAFSTVSYIFGEGNGHPLQYSCLENPRPEEPRWATVHGVAKSQTRLSDSHTHYIFYYLSYHLSCLLSLPSWNIYSTMNYSLGLEEYQAYYRKAKYICLMSEEIVPGPAIGKNLTHH